MSINRIEGQSYLIREDFLQVEKDAFLYFTLEFNGHSYYSKDYNIYRIVNSKIEDQQIQNYADKVVRVPGQKGSYFFGGKRKSKIFKISIAFDNVNYNKFEEIKELYNLLINYQGMVGLIFNEEPHKKYMVQLSETPIFSFLPFNGIEEIIYKGEASLTFTCQEGIAHSTFTYIRDITGQMDINVKEYICKAFGKDFPYFFGTFSEISDKYNRRLSVSKHQYSIGPSQFSTHFSKNFYIPNIGDYNSYPYIHIFSSINQFSYKISLYDNNNKLISKINDFILKPGFEIYINFKNKQAYIYNSNLGENRQIDLDIKDNFYLPPNFGDTSEDDNYYYINIEGTTDTKGASQTIIIEYEYLYI